MCFNYKVFWDWRNVFTFALTVNLRHQSKMTQRFCRLRNHVNRLSLSRLQEMQLTNYSVYSWYENLSTHNSATTIRYRSYGKTVTRRKTYAELDVPHWSFESIRCTMTSLFCSRCVVIQRCRFVVAKCTRTTTIALFMLFTTKLWCNWEEWSDRMFPFVRRKSANWRRFRT